MDGFAVNRQEIVEIWQEIHNLILGEIMHGRSCLWQFAGLVFLGRGLRSLCALFICYIKCFKLNGDVFALINKRFTKCTVETSWSSKYDVSNYAWPHNCQMRDV